MIKINLSTLLGQRRISMKELSKRTGIRQNTISDLYHETTERVNLRYLDMICDAIGCDLNELLVREPGEHPEGGVGWKKR